MDTENTRLIDEEKAPKEEVISTPSQEDAGYARKKGTGKGTAMAAGVGGFVAGAAVGAAASAFAASPAQEPELQEESEEKGKSEDENGAEAKVEAPAPEQVILANDEGIRYAHVDADNFSDAFAQARQQVGAGGVFEYNGRLYATYTAEEWRDLSGEERVEFQNHVSEVAHEAMSGNASGNHHSHNQSYASRSVTAEPQETHHETVAANAEMISAEPVDNEIRVLGVETIENDEGERMKIALVENGGDHALLVDLDNDGTIDVAVHDDDGNGNIEEHEVHPIQEAGIQVDDLIAVHAMQQEGDLLYASNDGMPDYINNADTMMDV